MATEVAVDAPAVAGNAPRAYSSVRLLGGFLGRAWLWFIAGCLTVTLLPLLFGWRPYVVQSGSMAPRIKVGDVILASPEKNPKVLLGHVTVFNDPDPSRAGTVKSHRVVKINPDGTMVTKGDANQSVDPTPLPVSDVIGIGRLLVRWIGLPLIWVEHGEWLKFGLFVGSLWFAFALVLRDVDPPKPEITDETDADGLNTDDDADDDGMDDADDIEDMDDVDDVDGVQTPSRLRGLIGRRAARPSDASPRATFTSIGRRAATGILAALALLLPTTQAAFAATTKDTGNTWSVPNYNYTAQTNALGPYLYWKLDDTGTTAADASGNNRTGTYNSTYTKQVTGALVDQTPNYAVTATNAAAPAASTSCVYTTTGVAGMAVPGPTNYSEVIWFKTTSTTGGKLIGLENNQTGISDSSSAGGQYDRMLYMDGAGEIWFGVWTGTTTTIHSAAGLNDGNWHMAAASMSTTGGMSLYIDGNLVGTNANTTSETETKTSYWRVGCGNLAGWGAAWTGPNAPANAEANNLNYPFNGSLDEATVWLSTLTSSQIAFLYFIR